MTPLRFKSIHGYTLVELMVAIGIFSILFIVLMGFFGRFVFMQRRDIAEQRLLEELRFAMEIFNREARTAYGSTYVPDNTGKGIVFVNQEGQCVHYRLEGTHGRLERAEWRGTTDICRPADDQEYTSLTSSKITLRDLHFTVTFAEQDEGMLTNQGFVTLTLEAEADNPTVMPLHVQSTITSRQTRPF
jgi:prepilin-type N-terminal cleavage/methylation domain-containing protein